MKDYEDRDTTPKTWREYLRESREVLVVCQWIWREIIPTSSKKLTKRFVAAMTLMLLFQLVQPWIVSLIIDGLVARHVTMITYGFIGLAFCVGVQKLLNWYECRVREIVIGDNIGAVDRRVTELFFEKSLGQHLQEGNSLNAANIDKGRWRMIEMQVMLLFEGVLIVLGLGLAYVLMWALSPPAGAIVTPFIIGYFVWSFYLNQQVVEVCAPVDRDFRRLNRRRVERWEKMERVKTSGKEQEELEEMNAEWVRILKIDRTFWLWFTNQSSVRGGIITAGWYVVLLYGAWHVWQGYWSIGLLYPLYTWVTRLNDNLWQLARLEHQLNWNMPSVRSLIDDLTIPPDVYCLPTAVQLTHQTPIRVSFQEVSYSYPRGSREEARHKQKCAVPVLKKVSFTIEPGEKVALIGPSGAGKTTIMRLLFRAMDPDEGLIRVNGALLRDVQLSSWLRLVGYIPQQAQIFDGTIRSNLLYALSREQRKGMTDDHLWQLMGMLQTDFGQRLTDGLDTLVGRNGTKLSGGQAQRVMICSAVAKRPLFMIIDEATSSLDSTTERLVHDGLQQALSGNMSALVIAHRLPTVRDLCTKFIVLKEATTVKPGESQVEAIAPSFEALHAVSPTFRQLAGDQGIIIG